VADAKNLSRAAAKLHVAQPALSRQVRSLERELHVALLDRHAKGVALTLAGEAFATEAKRILADIANALDRADAAGAGRSGRLVIGAMRAANASGIPAAVQEAMRRDHPEIDLLVQELEPPALANDVASGDIDLGIGLNQEPRATLHEEPLWREWIDRAVLPPRHPLAKRRSLRVPQLAVLPLLHSSRSISMDLFERVVKALEAAGFRSPIVSVDGDLRAVHLEVAAGRGWTLITRSRARTPPEGTTVVKVDGFDFTLDVQLLWRRDERRPLVRTVVEALYKVVREYATQVLRADPGLPPASARRAHRPHARQAVPPSLELRHLRALIAVAGTQSIGRGAERLGITQPALSRQLKELEHELGHPLLERTARGVKLTPAGAALARESPPPLVAVEQLAQDITRAKRGMEGRCVIGSVATTATTALLSAAVEHCAVRHPHVQVVITEVPTYGQAAALTRGDIDLGLAHLFPVTPPEDGLTRTTVIDDRLCAALIPANHPLAQKKTIRAKALADLPFLFMARTFHPGFYDRVFKALADLGLTPRVEAEYEALHAVWSLTALGKGWCIGWKSQLKRPPAGTAARRITGFDLPWGVELLSRRGDKNPAVTAVAKELRTISRVAAEIAG